MRGGIIVLGFSLIVLIVIAGCSSSQKASTGCDPTGPNQLQKFLPTVQGYNSLRQPFGISFTDPDSKLVRSTISQPFRISDKSNGNLIEVSITDWGPCVTESTGVNAVLNSNKVGAEGSNTTSKISDFHGYPAIHKIEYMTFPMDYVHVGVNNRLMVSVVVVDIDKEFSLSEADDDIERFANAIDFKGLASSV